MALISGRRPGAGTWRMVGALVRQRRRLALATLAIALAVGYLAGALSLLNRVSDGLDDLAAAGAEHADLVVEGDVAYESALEQTRRLVPVAVAEMLQGVPGIAAVAPRVEEITLLIDDDGVPLVAPGLSEQPLGTNWPDDEAMVPYEFVGEGRPPTGADEIVIDVGSAERAGVAVGDTIVAAARTLPGTYTVVGIVTTDQGPLPDGSTLALFSTEQARALFGAHDNDNRVAIRLEEDADAEAMRATIQSLLPGGTELVDGETAAEHRQESLTRSFALIRVLIMGFAALALVVGMITVANSLTLLYAERRRTLAAFRLVGAKPHQLMGAALIEAALLAAIASVIGLPLGLAFGRFIELVLGALGTSVPVGGSAISVSALAAALLVGVAATILAAVMPARRACRVAPIDAVVEVPDELGTSTAQRLLDASLISLGAGVGITGLLILFDIDARVALVVGVASTVLMVVAVLLPTALSSLVAGGITLVPLRPPTLRRIGARDAVRNRSRTAATTGALMLATTVVAGLAVFLSSFAASIDGDVTELVTSDLVVDSGTFTRGGLSAELLGQIGELEGVGAVSGWQVGRGTIDAQAIRLTGVDGMSLSDVLSPGWVQGSPTTLGPDEVLLSEQAAQEQGVSVGDQVPLVFHSGGVEMLTVAGTYDAGALLLGEAVVERSTLLRQVPASVDIAALVSLAEDSPEVRERVTELAKSFGVTSVLEPAEFVDRRSDLLRGFERVIQWMLFFTLAQALVGVVNTLLLSVGERRREFGLLRAAGAGRRQIHRLVLAEGLSFAVVGTLLGLALGIVGGVLAIRSLGRFGISGVSIPAVPLVLTGLLAVALGVAAAIVPARWAASVPPLEAVADTGAAGLGRPGRSLAAVIGRRARPAAPADAVPPPFRPAGAPVAAPVPSAPAPPAPPAPAPTAPTPAPAPPAPPPFRPPPVAPAAAAAGAGAAGGSWLRAQEGSDRRRPSEDAAGTPRPVFAARPRSAAPPAPDAARPGRGWQTGPEAAPDPIASIRLASALERLDPLTVRDAQPALVPLARALEADEEIHAVVQGWAKGLLCIVTRTDRRILVVVDRFPEPLVESLDLRATGIYLYGPPGSARASVSVVDGNRLLEVSGVRDVDEATALGSIPDRRPVDARSTPEYF